MQIDTRELRLERETMCVYKRTAESPSLIQVGEIQLDFVLDIFRLSDVAVMSPPSSETMLFFSLRNPARSPRSEYSETAHQGSSEVQTEMIRLKLGWSPREERRETEETKSILRKWKEREIKV